MKMEWRTRRVVRILGGRVLAIRETITKGIDCCIRILRFAYLEDRAAANRLYSLRD